MLQLQAPLMSILAANGKGQNIEFSILVTIESMHPHLDVTVKQQKKYYFLQHAVSSLVHLADNWLRDWRVIQPLREWLSSGVNKTSKSEHML